MPAGGDRRWGWHRLADGPARALVAGADVRPGDLVLDVGAGTGTLTALLLRAGARVVAVELHPQRAAGLRARFAGESVTVVQADACDLRLPRQPFAVVANPPYAATTALLRRLLAPGSRLERAHLVLPLHAALRWAHGPAPGASRWRAELTVTVAARLPPSAFRPAGPPSAVLALERYSSTRMVRRPSRRTEVSPG